jgi:hypothetical protein
MRDRILQSRRWILFPLIVLLILVCTSATIADWSQLTKLIPNDINPGDEFGWSVDVDGDTIIAGTYQDDAAIEDSGSAYVFVRNGDVWTQQAKLVPDDVDAYDRFGYSVSVDGDTAVIGTYQDDVAAINSGSAYVFARDGNTWTQRAKLVPDTPSAYKLFGRSVSVDGDTIVVGADGDPPGDINSGSAYVFVRDGDTWTQQAEIAAPDYSSGNGFGVSVSLDGDNVLIGDSRDSVGNDANGSAYVFTRSGTTWALQSQLLSSDPSEDAEFGIAVSLSGDTALIGAHKDDNGAVDTGSAYVFVRNGNTWTQQTKIIPSEFAEDNQFGSSVALYGDTAFIGVPGNNKSEMDAGNAYVFTRSGTTWTQQTKLTPPDMTESGFFGISAALDDGIGVIGAYHDDEAGFLSGSVYIFSDAPVTSTPPTITSPAPPDGTVQVAYNHTLTATGDATISYAVTSGALPDGLTLNGDTISGVPTVAGRFEGVVTAANNAGTDTQAFSIAISPDEAPTRVYPSDGATLTAANAADWSRFRFQHIDGIEWYGVWIGSADYTEHALYQWFPATAESTGLTTETPICNVVENICTLPQDLWLENGDYVWWISYWSPSSSDSGSYWNDTSFSVGFASPTAGLSDVVPSGTVNTIPTEVTWGRDHNTLWMQIWLGQVNGPNGSPYEAFYGWVDLTERCNASTCTLDLSSTTLPDGDYQMWVRVWGPGGYLEWTDVSGTSPAAAFTINTGAN